MTILVSVLCLVSIIAGLVFLRAVYYGLKFSDALFDIYSELSFEFLLKEECLQRINTSSSDAIRYIRNHGFLFRRNEMEKALVASFLLTYMEVKASLLEVVEENFTQNELKSRVYLFKTLDQMDKRRYEVFLSTGEILPSNDPLLVMIRSCSKNLEGTSCEQANLKAEIESLGGQVSTDTIEVTLVRKKPWGGRRPKKKTTIKAVGWALGGKLALYGHTS